jgi:hypothetical protein
MIRKACLCEYTQAEFYLIGFDLRLANGPPSEWDGSSFDLLAFWSRLKGAA